MHALFRVRSALTCMEQPRSIWHELQASSTTIPKGPSAHSFAWLPRVMLLWRLCWTGPEFLLVCRAVWGTRTRLRGLGCFATGTQGIKGARYICCYICTLVSTFCLLTLFPHTLYIGRLQATLPCKFCLRRHLSHAALAPCVGSAAGVAPVAPGMPVVRWCGWLVSCLAGSAWQGSVLLHFSWQLWGGWGLQGACLIQTAACQWLCLCAV